MDNKAVWDDETTGIFIHACLDQVYKKERTGLAFTKEGWKNIVSTFNQKTGKSYDRKQLKNRLDILKKDFKLWDSLLKETGVGVDPATNKVTVSDVWWTEKLQVKSAYRKFMRLGLKFERELRIIFKDVMATGDDFFSPCSTQPRTNQEEGNDVYRPAVDEEEGSGDNEDEHFGVDPNLSTGLSNEMASIGLAISTPSDTGPSASAYLQKRKRGEGSSKSKKQKMPAVHKIADAISAIADVTVDRAAALTEPDETSIGEVMKYLKSFDEFKNDIGFGVKCMKALETKARREFFVSLKGDPEYLFAWLRYIIKELDD